MRDPTRTALVVASTPHPWALLRDHLDPSLVRVAWVRPEAVAAAVLELVPGPWMLAGGVPDLPEGALSALRGCLFAAHWVGEPPSGLPVRSSRHATWSDLVAALRGAQDAGFGGLRLAPGRGLVLPGGRYAAATADLESLLAAGPAGLQLEPGARVGPALRRARRSLVRHRLGLHLVRRDGRVALATT